MQLAIAIVLIIIIMNIWLAIDAKTQRVIDQHVTLIGQNRAQEVHNSVNVFLKKQSINHKNKQLKAYVDSLVLSPLIKEARLYDINGQLIIASKHSTSLNEIYGITANKSNDSQQFISYVEELRDEKGKLKAYLRLVIEKSFLTTQLIKNNEERSQVERLMLILAGLIGFLLTRGLNRFSRQGYRTPKR